jgi:tetratricopeptide (TPR) repeat protein
VLADYAGDLESVDPRARARMHWLLARLALAKDERRLALKHMRSAIALLKGTEDTVRLARAHVMCGLILLWSDKTAAAAHHVEAATALLPRHADATDQGRLASLQAFLAARQRRYDDADRLADEALRLHAEDVRDQGVALYAKALAATALGRRETADASYEKASAALTALSMWRQAAVVVRDRADAAASWGEHDAARRWRTEADELDRRVEELSQRI